MPIKYTENYPVDWHALAFDIKEANEWTCQMCDKPCRTPGAVFDTFRLELTVAHVDHDYGGAEIFLACLCSVCHMKMDARHSGYFRRRNDRWRRLRAGQLAWGWAA